jgi:propionyl-CoA carboxylase alpha chain
VVSVHYDPMLAKVIAWAPDRSSAARALATALARAQIHGPRTNRDLLVNVLRHPAFLSGHIDTAFFDRHGLDTLAAPLADPDTVRLSALAAALAGAAANRAAATVLGRLPSGWRNVASGPRRTRFLAGEREIEVAYLLTRDGLRAEGFDGMSLLSADPERVVLRVGGLRRSFTVSRYGDELVAVDSASGPVSLTPVPRFRDPESTLASGSLLAPMPGTVVRLGASAGEAVRAGQPLLWLEAMKMEHRIESPSAGMLTELRVGVGDAVDTGALLAVVSKDRSPKDQAENEETP